MSVRSVTSRRALGVAGSLAATAIFALSGTTLAARPVASSQGYGSLDNGKRHFAFSAQLYNATTGAARGQANLINPAFTGTNGKSPYRLHIDIKCMKVVDKTAYFGGTIKSTNDPSLLDAVFFAVQDNGEPGKNRDMISRVAFWDDDPGTTGDPMACLNMPDPNTPLETISSGNVQVRSS